MVESHEDPEIVHSQRSYDVIKSHEFAERGINRPAGSDTEGRPTLPDGPDPAQDVQMSAAPDTEATMLVAAPQHPPPQPIDAGTAYRRARLGVCVCLVLALALAWIAQRKSQNKAGRT